MPISFGKETWQSKWLYIEQFYKDEEDMSTPHMVATPRGPAGTPTVWATHVGRMGQALYNPKWVEWAYPVGDVGDLVPSALHGRPVAGGCAGWAQTGTPQCGCHINMALQNPSKQCPKKLLDIL